MQPTLIPLRHDMALLPLSAQRYRTNRLTGIFAVPLLPSTAAAYAVLPGLLTRRTRRYPTVTAMERQLGSLYGAAFIGQTYRMGQWQVLQFTVDFLKAEYTLGQEDLTGACTDLLLDGLFDPAMEGGVFRPADVAQEQRCLMERLQAELNNKRLYARRRCEELLCPDQPYSTNPNGTAETVAALTPAEAAEAWQRLLSSARIRWIYQGDGDVSALAKKLERRFDTLALRRAVQLDTDTSFTLKQSERTDEMPLQQAKLVLGFRIAAAEPDGQVAAARLMNALLGGGPASLLFRHVREEQSLCYYCVSTYDRLAGVMLVDSGVDAADAERTKNEILRQLEAIRQGQFSEEELEAARRSLIQQFASAEESTASLDGFYISQTLYDRYVTPEQVGSSLLAVTREDVCRVAKLVHFDTTYLLRPKTEEEAE